MRNDIQTIREALERIEASADENENLLASAGLSGLELPDIIRDTVDLLEPELKPYEFSFYMWLLRHSVVANNTQLIRVGRRPMQSGVIKSPSSKTNEYSLSYGTVQQTFEGLESVGAIRQEGDTTREGTLYRVISLKKSQCVRNGEKSFARLKPQRPTIARWTTTMSEKIACWCSNATTTHAPIAANSSLGSPQRSTTSSP